MLPGGAVIFNPSPALLTEPLLSPRSMPILLELVAPGCPGVTAPYPPKAPIPTLTLNCGAGEIARCMNGVVGRLNSGVWAPDRPTEEYIIGLHSLCRLPWRPCEAALEAAADDDEVAPPTCSFGTTVSLLLVALLLLTITVAVVAWSLP